MTDTQSRPLAVVSFPAPTELEQSMCPFLGDGAGDNHAVDKLLQRLGTETQSCPPPVVSPPAPTELEQLMRSFLAGRRRRRQQPCSGQVVTATGDGNTELSPSGCESSSTDIIRTVDVLIHHGTAPATAIATTATRPAGLEQRVMFLQWEVGSCSNTMPEFE